MRLLLLIPLLMIIGCENPHVRLINRSDVPLEDVVVGFPSGQVSYGTIPPGGATDYKQAKGAYRYAYVEANVQGKQVTLQPIDYVGESPLKGGKYAYVLTYTPSAEAETLGQLRLEFVRE